MAVVRPIFVPAVSFGSDPSNVPSAFDANDATTIASSVAAQRPPNERRQTKWMYSNATSSEQNVHSQLARNPPMSWRSLVSGASERRMPSAERFACVEHTVVTAKVIAINAVIASSA